MCARARVRACVCAQNRNNALARVCVRVIARDALLARCGGLCGVLARCPIDNPPDPLKRLKTAYTALKKNKKFFGKALTRRASGCKIALTVRESAPLGRVSADTLAAAVVTKHRQQNIEKHHCKSAQGARRKS